MRTNLDGMQGETTISSIPDLEKDYLKKNNKKTKQIVLDYLDAVATIVIQLNNRMQCRLTENRTCLRGNNESLTLHPAKEF
jgi:hypothetical protein